MEFTNFEGSKLPQIAQNIKVWMIMLFCTCFKLFDVSIIIPTWGVHAFFLKSIPRSLNRRPTKTIGDRHCTALGGETGKLLKKLNNHHNRGRARCLKRDPLVIVIITIIIIIGIIKVKEVIITHLVQDATGVKQGHRVFSGWVEAAFMDSALAVAEVERENCSLE